jgi:hypothetical protein
VFQVGGYFAAVFNFADSALRACSHMGSDFNQTEHVFAKTTLAQGVLTLSRLVFYLLLLNDSKTTALANNLNEQAVV